MTVPSFQFLILAVLSAVAFNCFSSPWWRALILLALNLFFIHTFTSKLVLLLPYAGFLLLGYVGVLLRRLRARWTAWIFPITVLLAFVWLKKYLFIPDGLMLHSVYLTIGLSYVFFRVMHLVIDGWEEVPRGATGLLSYVNYTLNFTSLISGPIQRYDDYRSFENEPLPLDLPIIGRACERIVVGFFKVYIVSSLLHGLQAHHIAALATAQALPAQVWEVMLVIGIYPLYLYFNFSGYTDFVIGCARLFRIELPENFRAPFAALNFIDFWSRWHITLSRWLKDYVYSPLLLTAMRRIPAPEVLPLLAMGAYFLTFFLVGAWHGQTSEFLIFGLLQGGGVAGNKFYQEAIAARLGRDGYEHLSNNPVYIALCRGFTFTWFAFTLLWFWTSWAKMTASVAHTQAMAVPLSLALLFSAATLAMGMAAIFARCASRGRVILSLLASRYARTAYATAMATVIIVSIVVIAAPAPEIVYKAF
ncbi:MBOAT family O-acyltransferase [Sphingomonas bacterium]|uniref:MBOAT family O-acyltransferase n=1 Tax=Sphingomonas bacterium TaxID=1895847 RepID=UPI0015757AB4|nr:MBOAT family O-acyltransferase [Sphingomonas bacterium]